MSDKTVREQVLDALPFLKKDVDQAKDIARDNTQTLDALGVERKERDVSETDKATVDQIADKVATDLKTADQEGKIQMDEESLKMLITASLGDMMPDADAEPEADEPPAVAGKSADQGAVLDAVTATLVEASKDIGTVAERQKELEESIVPALAAIAARLEEVEGQIANRPRAASEAPETVLAPPNEEQKEYKKLFDQLLGDVEKGTQAEKTVLGVPVKD